MSITTIENQVTPIATQHQVVSGAKSPADGVSSAADSQLTDEVHISLTATLKNQEIRALEQLHSKKNERAKGVQATNEGINNLSEQINQMSAKLEVIIKNFPPFSKDCEQRQELLMSYNSIRQEILKMSVPAPPTPVHEKIQGMWDSLFSENGQILPTAVSALADSSSSRKVKNALNQAQVFSSKLSSISTAATQAAATIEEVEAIIG